MCYYGIIFVLNPEERVKEEMEINSPIKSLSAYLPYGVFLFLISGPLFMGN